MPDERLTYARELERRDGEVAGSIARLDVVASRAEELRSRAAELDSFLIELPVRRAGLAEAVARSAAELERLAAEAATADAELTRQEQRQRVDEQALATARRAAVTARDRASGATRALARARDEQALLERDADAAKADAPEIEAAAARTAVELDGLPRVSREAAHTSCDTLAGVVEWGSRARAALFVARSSLAAEQDRIIREAVELGTAVLGEQVAGSSVAHVRERVERALAET